MCLNTQGNNEKTLQINSLNDIKTIRLFCFDKNLIKNKQLLKFQDSGIYLNLIDETKKNVLVEVDTNDVGNICHLATLDNSSIMGAKWVNISQISMLNEVTFEELMK